MGYNVLYIILMECFNITRQKPSVLCSVIFSPGWSEILWYCYPNCKSFILSRVPCLPTNWHYFSQKYCAEELVIYRTCKIKMSIVGVVFNWCVRASINSLELKRSFAWLRITKKMERNRTLTDHTHHINFRSLYNIDVEHLMQQLTRSKSVHH